MLSKIVSCSSLAGLASARVGAIVERNISSRTSLDLMMRCHNGSFHVRTQLVCLSAIQHAKLSDWSGHVSRWDRIAKNRS